MRSDLNYCNYNMFLATTLLQNLTNVEERQEAVKWIRKLSSSSNSIDEIKLRNDFMYYLVLNIQNFAMKEPFTDDLQNGASLTKIMEEDLTSSNTNVYDTMTKDAGDVMSNTQIGLDQLYAEKQQKLEDSMLRSLLIIKDYVPDFDFQLYFQDPAKYLSNFFKLTDLSDNEEVESARRQLAYHRVKWLQSEAERLQAENIKLEERVEELKQVKRKQIIEASIKEREAKTKIIELEKMQSELEKLLAMHKAIITEKTDLMNTKKEKAIKILKPAIGDVKSRLRQPDWNVNVASEYSKAHIQGEAIGDVKSRLRQPDWNVKVASEYSKPQIQREAIGDVKSRLRQPDWSDKVASEYSKAKIQGEAIGDVKSRLRQPDWNVKAASEYSKAQIQRDAIGDVKSRLRQPDWSVKVASEYSKPQIQREAIGDVKSRLRQPDWIVKVASEYSKAQIQREAARLASASETDARCKTRDTKRRPKRPVSKHARPDWQDVNVNKFYDGGRRAANDVPIDNLTSWYFSRRSSFCAYM